MPSGHSNLKAMFNWKQNTVSVFFVAIPLALIGFSCLAVQAWLRWKLDGELAPAIIYAAGLVLLAVALVPAYRMQRSLRALTRATGDGTAA
jgi:uncharacterized membrane protein